MTRNTLAIALMLLLAPVTSNLPAAPGTYKANSPAASSPNVSNTRNVSNTPNASEIRNRVREVVREAKSFMHGVAKPIREVDLTSPSSGTISNVMVEDGAKVTKGQPLIEFDVRLTDARLGMAEADFQRSNSAVKATELEYQLATSRFKNTAEAYRQNAATNVELTETQIRWQQARARYQAAMDEVNSSAESRRYAQVEKQLRLVEAPFDGTVVQVLAVPGQTPTVQDKLLQLVDTSKLRIDLYVPVTQFEQIAGKRNVDIQADSPVNKLLNARVVVIDDVIEPATQTIRCVLELDNAAGDLPAGFRVRL